MATSKLYSKSSTTTVLCESLFGELSSLSDVSLALQNLRDNLHIFTGKKCLRPLDILCNMLIARTAGRAGLCKLLAQASSDTDIIKFFEIFKDLFDSIRKSDKHKFYENNKAHQINYCINVLIRCQKVFSSVYEHACDALRTQGRDNIIEQFDQKKLDFDKILLLLQCRVHAEYIDIYPEATSPYLAGFYGLHRQTSLDTARAGQTAARLPFDDQKEDLLWTKLRSCSSADDLKLENHDTSCPVCLDSSIEEDFAILDGCRHIVCRSCAESLFFIMCQTLKKECPLCRTAVGLWTTKKFYEDYSKLDTRTVLRVNPLSFKAYRVSLDN